MERLTEHHMNKSLGAYMVCSGSCIDDDFDCNACPKLAKIVDCLAAYEDTGLSPETVNDLVERFSYFYRTVEGLDIVDPVHFGAFVDRVKHWAQADKDGRLAVLPFCVGAPLYEATKKGVCEYEVEQFSIGSEDLLIHALDKVIWYRGGRIFGLDQIGKTVFLTREEAEAALKKSEGAGNEAD